MSYYPPPPPQYPPPQGQGPYWRQYDPGHYPPQPEKRRRHLWPWFVVGTVVLVAAATTLAALLWPRGGAQARPTTSQSSPAAKGPLTGMSAATAGALLTKAAKFPDQYQTMLFSSDSAGLGAPAPGIPPECALPLKSTAFSVIQQLVGKKPDDQFGTDVIIMMLFTWTGQDQTSAFKAWPSACPTFSLPGPPGDGYTVSLTDTFSAIPVPSDPPGAVGVKEKIDTFKTDDTPGAQQQQTGSLPRYNYLVTIRGVALLGFCSGDVHHDLCDQIYKNSISALRDLP